MTVAQFLVECAEIFEQKSVFHDKPRARQCRDYALIALNLETADAARRENAATARAVATARDRAAERARRAKKAPELPPYTP